MNIKYVKPNCFYKKQSEIYDCDSRFTYTLSGNKTGKTFSHALWINEQAILGPEGTEYAWVAPIFSTAEVAFKLLKKLITASSLYKKLEEEDSPNKFKFNISKMRIYYPNGNTIYFLSGDKPDSIFGREYHASVVDEASRLKEESFDALLSTMFVTEGPVKLISNPTIKNNWFYQKWLKIRKGEVPDSKAYKLTALDAIEAGIMPQSTFDFAKKTYSPAIFKRDFLAEVPDSEVSVFKADKVYENILKEAPDNSLNKVKFIGVDLGFTEGQKSDYTVVSGLDKNGNLRFYKRFKKSGENLINTLKAYIGNLPSYIDATGGGITIYQLLKKDCPNLEPYNFNNSSKCLCIETLAYYIHSEKIKYPEIKELLDELIGYEIETTKTGKTTYNNGKSADHDDTVISLGLAVLKLKEQEDEGENYTYNIFSEDSEMEDESIWHDIEDEYSFEYNF